MKKAATSLIAALIVILMIIALNSLCAGCVYAQQSASPAKSAYTDKGGQIKDMKSPSLHTDAGIFAHVDRPNH